MPRVPCSLYPTHDHHHHHSNNRKISLAMRVPPDPWTWKEQALIGSSSLFLVGSVFWVPAVYAWLYKRWKGIPASDRKRRALYGALLLAVTSLVIVGPQRKPWFAEKIGFRNWKIWQLWCQFVAMEVWKDETKAPPTIANKRSNNLNKSNDTNAAKKSTTKTFEYKKDSSITAISPHGIFPFAIGVAAIPQMAEQAFGKLRIMVATATYLFPMVRDIISLVHAVDASRPSVDQALSEGSRIGLVPGGIPEIFEGYPKPLTHPDDEIAIVPKGFLRMALRHQIPVVPVYAFGITKLFKRLQLPDIVERWSTMLRISICLFFGVAGLPIPFRQKLFYIMGDPIVPPSTDTANASTVNTAEQETQAVNQMHQAFCEELMRLFENHKELYGWGHKSLHLISR